MSLLLARQGAVVTLVEDLSGPYTIDGGQWANVAVLQSTSEEFVFQSSTSALEQDSPSLVVVWTEAGLVFTPAEEFVFPHLSDEAPPLFTADTPWFTQPASSDAEFSAPHLSEDGSVFLWPLASEAWVIPLPAVDEAAPTQSTPDDASGVAPAIVWETWVGPVVVSDDLASPATTAALDEQAPVLQIPWSDGWVPSVPVDAEFSAPHLDDGVVFWPAPAEVWVTAQPTVDEAAPTQSTPDDASPVLWPAVQETWTIPASFGDDYATSATPALDEHAPPLQVLWADEPRAPTQGEAEFSAPHLTDEDVPNLPPMWVDSWWLPPAVESEAFPGSSIGYTDATPAIFNLTPVTATSDAPVRLPDLRQSGGSGAPGYVSYTPSPAEWAYQERVGYPRRLLPSRVRTPDPTEWAGQSEASASESALRASNTSSSGSSRARPSTVTVDVATASWSAKRADSAVGLDLARVHVARATSVAAARATPSVVVSVPASATTAASSNSSKLRQPSLGTGTAASAGSSAATPADVDQRSWLAEQAPAIEAPFDANALERELLAELLAPLDSTAVERRVLAQVVVSIGDVAKDLEDQIAESYEDLNPYKRAA